MPTPTSQSNPAFRVHAGTTRAAPAASHSTVSRVSGTGKSDDIVSPLPPPPPSALRPSRHTTLVSKTSDRRLLVDLTGADDDAVLATRPRAPSTPRKTPKRLAERDSGEDVRIVGEAAVIRNRINETPTKRPRFTFSPRTVRTASAIKTPPRPAITATEIGDWVSKVKDAGPETPSRIVRRPTMLEQLPPTPPGRNQPATPPSRGSSSFHGPSSVLSQPFFSPVSTLSFAPRRRDGSSPSPLSRRRDKKKPIYFRDSDLDEDDKGYNYDNQIDADALYERALDNWYHEAQETSPEAVGDRARPENANTNGSGSGSGNGNGKGNGAEQAARPENFIRRRPVSLAEVWTLPLNDRGEPPFPTLGPDCRVCRRPTTFRHVSTNNPNGNALRPYYVCCSCDAFLTWADRRGISAENARCHCGEPSRQDRVGKNPRGEKILRPGTPFWTCWQKRCDFFAYG
ncbi:hypothetical protein B0H67DRAFT_554730 [Lasiosphaeris hirsuta]|uniref:GRF-like zinc ribbon domain-containing protein n=1 Tax=Lasiosphaeris hirsuta TaxID=260670 RepID=A0AA40DRI4_9PEZI|nr:hypothetical protein B0H67DRAFT_554730 [Lasiosphaeris hirsuta]